MQNKPYNLKNWWMAALVGLAACSPSFVANSDYDRRANFRTYQTYQIVDEAVAQRRDEDPVLNSNLNRKRIREAIRTQLAARNYEPTDNNPDLLIKFYTRVRDRQQVQNNNTWGSRWGWNPWMGNNTYTRNYKESTLIVEVTDTKTNDLVWQGWVAGEMDRSNRNPDVRIAEKVNELFSEYPVKAFNRTSDPVAQQ